MLVWSFQEKLLKFGNEVSGLKIGDRVMCSGSSAWAEYAITDWGRVIKIPDNNMDFDVACTLTNCFRGPWHNAIITTGQLEKGQSILIQGASSGVGLMGLQIAKYMESKNCYRHFY